MIKINKIIFFVLLFSVVYGFFFGDTPLYYAILISILSLLLFFGQREYSSLINKQFAISIGLVACCIVSSLFLCKYPQTYTIFNFVLVVQLLLIVQKYELIENFPFFITNILYYIVIIYLSWQVYQSVMVEDSEIHLSFMSDSNYVGIIVFLMFLLANKLGKPIGIIAGVAFAVYFSDSRSYLLLMILFYVVFFFNRKIREFLNNRNITFGKILAYLTVFSIILSLIWVFVISANGTTGYHESLNDLSNRMRFVSNVKALTLFLKPSETLLWGYGSYILNALGISENNSAIFMGLRLVQPHNSYINLLLRMGIVPGIIYFSILAQILNRFKDDVNLAYLIPYLINAMFMHSLLNGKWLIFFIIVILTPQKHTKVSFSIGKYKIGF